MSILIQSCAWEEHINLLKHRFSGKNRFTISNYPTGAPDLFGIDGVSIDLEWNISQDSHRLRFSNMFSKIRMFDEQIQINLREELYSCRYSMTSNV